MRLCDKTKDYQILFEIEYSDVIQGHKRQGPIKFRIMACMTCMNMCLWQSSHVFMPLSELPCPDIPCPFFHESSAMVLLLSTILPFW